MKSVSFIIREEIADFRTKQNNHMLESNVYKTYNFIIEDIFDSVNVKLNLLVRSTSFNM